MRQFSNILVYINNIIVAVVLVGGIYFGKKEYDQWFDPVTGTLAKSKKEAIEVQDRLRDQLTDVANEYRKNVIKELAYRDLLECKVRVDYHCDLARRTLASERIQGEEIGTTSKELNDLVTRASQYDTERLARGEAVVQLR